MSSDRRRRRRRRAVCGRRALRVFWVRARVSWAPPERANSVSVASARVGVALIRALLKLCAADEIQTSARLHLAVILAKLGHPPVCGCALCRVRLSGEAPVDGMRRHRRESRAAVRR